MACETIEDTIEEKLFVTTQWPATRQVLMKMKLAKTFGSALADIVMGLKGNGDKNNDSAQLDAFRSAIDSVFEKNTPEDITALLIDIVANGSTKIEGKRITASNVDEVFNDLGTMALYKACLFVIKANYKDFFKGQKAKDLLASVEEKL
jgi:hypothetical protein